MKRQVNIKKDLSIVKKLIDKKKEKLDQLKKEIAYLEMREATGTENKKSLISLMNEAYNTNDIGQVITAGGALYGE